MPIKSTERVKVSMGFRHEAGMERTRGSRLSLEPIDRALGGPERTGSPFH
jgi:hypothetical protein